MPEEKQIKLEKGDKAPDFELTDHDNVVVSLSTLSGKPFILYFYPKDDTPGCTREACDFRDNFNRVVSLGVEVFGVSPDGIERHMKFAEKYELPFKLLADPSHKTLMDYGAWGVKKRFGKEFEGVIRSTFIIDQNGKVYKSWKNVRVDGHVEKVLTQVEKLLSK